MTARFQKITVSFCDMLPSQKKPVITAKPSLNSHKTHKKHSKNPQKTIKKLLKNATKIYIKTRKNY
jgi:hypothetical protein